MELTADLFKSTFATIWFNLTPDDADARKHTIEELWSGWCDSNARVLVTSWGEESAEVVLVWDSVQDMEKYRDLCEWIAQQLTHLPDVFVMTVSHAVMMVSRPTGDVVIEQH